MLCRNISEDKLEGILGKRLFYRLKSIVEELIRQEQEVYSSLCENYPSYFNEPLVQTK